MKTFYLPFVFIFLFSCHSTKENHTIIPVDSANGNISIDSLHHDEEDGDEGDDHDLDSLTCDDLDNKNVIYDLASQVELNGASPQLDTGLYVYVFRDHFISADTISTLVLVAGISGPPFGTACDVLLLYRCGEKATPVFSEITGGFTKESIRDLDGDGVVEIMHSGDDMNMGEWHSNYEIFNFKNGSRNVLYESESYSIVDAFDYTHFKKGDTLGIETNSNPIDLDKDSVFEIEESRKISIYNGGKTESEILKRQIVKHDSTIVRLKNF